MVRSFEDLTFRGQARWLSHLARRALPAFGISKAEMQLVQHAENTTFRVDTPDRTELEPSDWRSIENRFLLRIHRKGYQGREEICSELDWLSALRKDTPLTVPSPVATLDGEWVAIACTDRIPEGRNCSLLRWMGGRCFSEGPTRARAIRIGRLAAQLHRHARFWSRPTGFRRRSWDCDGLFGDSGGFGMPVAEVLERLSPERREIVKGVRERTRCAMELLEQAGNAGGLIHADLHMGNLLFSGDDVRVIDFDDCGFGHWIYDLAVPIADWYDREDWQDLRDAFLDGYRGVMPLAAIQVAQLDTFVAARLVSLALWTVGRTADHPRFRERSEGWLQWCLAYPQRFLRP